MGELLKLASIIQANNKDEAVAIQEYTCFLQQVTDSGIDEKDKGVIFDVINEIIADELNHQKKLQELYTMLTSITPNER